MLTAILGLQLAVHFDRRQALGIPHGQRRLVQLPWLRHLPFPLRLLVMSLESEFTSKLIGRQCWGEELRTSSIQIAGIIN